MVHIIYDAVREQKTCRAVRTLSVVSKLRQSAVMLAPPSQFDIEARRRRSTASRRRSSAFLSLESFSQLQQDEICQTFNDLDEDGNGWITKDDLGDLLSRLGSRLTENAVETLMFQLDRDSDGTVTREEFLHWYKKYILTDPSAHEERARQLFDSFDQDSNSEITIGEFKRRLEALNMGFMIKETGAIVSELDRDRNGTVSFREFVQLFDKYDPSELDSSDAVSRA